MCEAMTEQSTFRKGIRLVGLIVVGGLILSGCLGRPAEPRGASTAESSEARATRLRLSDPQHTYVFESRGE
jgi:hypothetical protein